MKKLASIQEMEGQKENLLLSISLPHLLSSDALPPLLKSADRKYIADLLDRVDMPWDGEGVCPEVSQFFSDVILSSNDGAQLCTQSDIELLEKVNLSGEDVIHRGPFGTIQAAFPVRLRGKMIHCVWSGRLKDKPFSPEDVARIAEITELSSQQIEDRIASIPILSDPMCDQMLDACRKLRDSLKQAISQHLQAREMSDELVKSERTHSLGTLSGGVAHHFNNLLSVILGYASYVHNRENLSEEADNALLKITEAAQRGRRLTEEILAFTGSDSEEEEPCKVHDTISSVLSLLQSQVTSGVKITSHLEAKSHVVVSPPGSIRQIIFSLLSNAIDSMASEGELTVSTSNTDIDSKAFLKLEVRDSSGRVPEGISPELDQVSKATDTLVGERTGVQFSSLYGMVGRLDGTITVASEPGQHTCVEVLLPVSQQGTSPNSAMKAKHKLAPSEIWVVDDDPIFREMCNQVLTDEGHSVQVLSGGREMRELWTSRSETPDLIIVDFSMPEYNGLELCEWLREQGAQVPVILVSGFAPNQRDIRKALQLRKTYFLQKPFTFREMADTVTVALGETLIGE